MNLYTLHSHLRTQTPKVQRWIFLSLLLLFVCSRFIYAAGIATPPASNRNTTAPFDPSNKPFKRYDGTNLRYRTPTKNNGSFPPGPKTTCGQYILNSKQYKTCLRTSLTGCDPTSPRGLIDFETIPGGVTPIGGFLLTDQFKLSHGVTFCRETAPGVCDPVNLVEYGVAPLSGQIMCNNTTPGCTFGPDVVGKPRTGQTINFGRFGAFDTGKDFSGNVSPNKTPAIFMNYLEPTSKASGVLGDLDDGEQITIQALDASNNILEQRVMNDGDPRTGNGLGSWWQFDFGDYKVISKIRIQSTKNGWIIDNLAPWGACQPVEERDPCNANSSRGLIDFEKLPNASLATDLMNISDQFLYSHGVRFCADINKDRQCDTNSGAIVPAVLAKVGAPQTVFVGTLGADTPEPGKNIGNFFMTPSAVATDGGGIVVKYVSPVSETSGVLIDIDGSELVTVEALDKNGNLTNANPAAVGGNRLDITSAKIDIASGDPGTGTTKVVPWSFKHASADIHGLSLRFTSSSQGFAFDKFSPSSALCAQPVLDPCDPNVKNGLITFEQIPSGLNSDGSIIWAGNPKSQAGWNTLGDYGPLSNQYQATHGVTFCRSSTKGALVCGPNPAAFARAGSPQTAFGAAPGDDTPVASENLGSYSFTDDGNKDSENDILILYDTPTQYASGKVIDVSGTEVITFDAFDTSGTLVATQTINTSSSKVGDGIGTPWSLSSASKNIVKIRINQLTHGFGFDNFAPRGLCGG